MKDTKVISLEFSDLELLIGLTKKNKERDIYFWNWRTAELLSVVNSSQEYPCKTISVSPNFPTRVAHWSKNRLQVWQAHMCYKNLFVSKHGVTFNAKVKTPADLLWNSDGLLYLLDSSVSLYTVNLENGLLRLETEIPNSFEVDEDVSHGVHLGAHSSGIITYAQGQVCLLKRRPDGWAIIWTCIAPTILLDVVCFTTSSGKEQVYCLSDNNQLMTVTATGENEIEMPVIREFGKTFDMFCIIQPTALNFIAFNKETKELTLWETASAKQVDGSLLKNLEGLLLMVPSPNKPFVVLSFSNGLLCIFYVPSRKTHYLFPSYLPIDSIKFAPKGNRFVAASLHNGQLFLVDVEKLNEIKIIASLRIGKIITDYILQTNSSTKLSILIPADASKQAKGPTILMYTLDSAKEIFVADKEVKLSVSYKSISTTSSAIFAVPSNSNKIIKFNEDFELVKEIETDHKSPFFMVKTNKNFIFTFGEDGLVDGYNVKDGNTNKIISLHSHHYADGGVFNMDFDVGATTLLVAGKSGNITSYNTGLAYIKTNIEDDIFEASEPFKVNEIETWLQRQERKRVEKVQEQYKEVKTSLGNRLDKVKTAIKDLLDENETLGENEKLNIAQFDLDTSGRNRRIDEEGVSRLKLQARIMNQVRTQNELSARIIESTWNKMDIPSKELKPLSGNGRCPTVSSYGLLKKKNQHKQEWMKERLKLADYFHHGDFFKPWVPMHESELRTMLIDTTESRLLSRRGTLVQELLQSDHQSTKQFQSTSTENFLQKRNLPHSILQVHTGYHAQEVVELTEDVVDDLMRWFNKEFNQIYGEKEAKMKVLQERRARLRHVVSELELFDYPCDLKEHDLVDPNWAPTEAPETILTVSESELTVEPYLSPEDIKERNRLAEEEETRYSLLLLDDFRMRALDVMMDGVLEKQWQDEIKKPIPKPKFMDEKDVSTWTDDEVRKANVYNDSVEKLEAERGRYNKLLIAEFMQLKAFTKESGMQFDDKLRKLHELKLRVESAVCEEQLNILILRHEMLKRVQLERNEEVLRSAILIEEKKLAVLFEDGGRLQDILNEGRAANETLLVRDKNLDKNFKKDFPDYSSVLCEQLHKLSKKRPKLSGRISNNAAVLSELGRFVVQNKDRTKRLPLPPDGLEFLKGVDALDAQINMPSVVNEASWETLCRLRRTKIDSELKMKALSIDIAETEQTAILWQKQIKNCKDGILRKQTELEALLEEKIMLEIDCLVQLVLPQRVVEVPTTGHISDFKNVSLIPKSIVDDVNCAIQKVGQEKVRALEKSSEFRKRILSKEWEHRKLELEMEELKAHKESYEQVHVTKEFQDILNARAKGTYEEKGFTHLENEIKAVRSRYVKTEVALLESLEKYENKIVALERQNAFLDKEIVALNKELEEKSMLRDTEAEEAQSKEAKIRMKNILEHSKLLSQSQELEVELAELTAERDALRLKIHPTIVHTN